MLENGTGITFDQCKMRKNDNFWCDSVTAVTKEKYQFFFYLKKCSTFRVVRDGILENGPLCDYDLGDCCLRWTADPDADVDECVNYCEMCLLY